MSYSYFTGRVDAGGQLVPDDQCVAVGGLIIGGEMSARSAIWLTAFFA